MMNPSIIMVEDNQGDVILFKEALNEAIYDPKNLNAIDIKIIDNGEDAKNYFKKISSDSKVESNQINFPDLIILDINLPKLNGKELLEFIKSQDKLRNLKVIMFSTSSYQPDIEFCIGLQVNDYFVKPDQFDELITLVNQIYNKYLIKNKN